MGRRLISVFLMLCVLLGLTVTVLARNFDSERVGSIAVTLADRDGRTPITGAELSLYYVATVRLNERNNLSYTFTDAFENCGSTLDDSVLPAKLDAFVKEHAVSAEKLLTDPHGTVTFTNLPLGLYFVYLHNGRQQSRDGPVQCGAMICKKIGWEL